MKFNHQEYVEIYSALKEGCWITHDVKAELVKRLEQYMIQVAMHNDFHPKKKEANPQWSSQKGIAHRSSAPDNY